MTFIAGFTVIIILLIIVYLILSPLLFIDKNEKHFLKLVKKKKRLELEIETITNEQQNKDENKQLHEEALNKYKNDLQQCEKKLVPFITCKEQQND